MRGVRGYYIKEGGGRINGGDLTDESGVTNMTKSSNFV